MYEVRELQITEKGKIRVKKLGKHMRLPSISEFLFSFMGLFSLALIIKNSDVAIEYMKRGLSLCTKTVIPSLFPFMVVSDIIVSSGITAYAAPILKKPMKLLFGIGGEGGCAVFLGTLCGFPIGARSAVSLYDKGRISKGELERILTFANNPSSAFIISAVGMTLFGDREFGRVLYLTTLISAALTGIAGKLLFGKKSEINMPMTCICDANRTLGSAEIFTEAVSSSALGMLKVCAFVVFFSAFVGTVGMASERAVLPQEVRTLIFSLCELTSGVAEAANLSSRKNGAILAAFASGWSGFSVHFQIMSICSGRDISLKPYFLSKLFQGLAGAFLMWLWIYIRNG